MKRIIKFVAISFACLGLTGCGEKELSQCVASTEQLVLLRQMALTGRIKESFERCLHVENYGMDRCRATWLNADGAVMDCMVQQGYTFASEDTGLGFCTLAHYEDPKCYRLTWILMLPVSLRKHFWKPYGPKE
jgi:hypothetical protein